MAEFIDEVKLVKLMLDQHLFEDLDYTQVASLIERGNQRVAPVGEVLCESRTIDEKLILLLDGSLRLESAEGEEVTRLKPVRVLGEMGVFTGQTRSSRVVVAEDATLLELEAGDIQELLEEDPQIGNHMLANLIKLLYSRVHDANDQVAGLKYETGRLHARLRELAPDDPLLEELFPTQALE